MFSEASVSHSVHREVCIWGVCFRRSASRGRGVCIQGRGSASRGKGSASRGRGLHSGGGGLHPRGSASRPKSSASRGKGVCIQGKGDLHPGGGVYIHRVCMRWGIPPPPELGKRAVRILLECFPVVLCFAPHCCNTFLVVCTWHMQRLFRASSGPETLISIHVFTNKCQPIFSTRFVILTWLQLDVR